MSIPSGGTAGAAPPPQVRPLLPPDWRLQLDPAVRVVDDGRTLIGGSPLRILRLSAAGASVLARLAEGEQLGESVARRNLARRLFDAGFAHPRPASEGERSPAPRDVTAVVPVRGHPDQLERTLAALAGEGLAGIVVVDDGSDPADAEAIAVVAQRFGALLLRRQVNGGPAAARNTGMAAVRTPLVAFVDVDVIPEGGWLVDLLAHLADGAVIAVAPRVRSRPTDGGVRDRFERRHSPLDLGTAEARVAPRTRIAYVPTALLVARMEAIDCAGGFDDALRFGEDVDLVWRLIAAGGTVRYQPEAAASHAPRSSWSAWVRQRVGYGSAAAPLARRHPGDVPPLAVSWWSLLAWGLAAAGRSVAGVTTAAASTALLPRKLRGHVSHPWVEALRLAGWGHLLAGRWIARAVLRPWWPLALAAALVSRRARWAVVAAATVPALLDWDADMGIDRARYLVLRLADDVAYGAGVWVGCWRERSIAALLPELRSWPGRRADA
jgi:mycofactocin system glycosyltransferase